ncbi:hypothetical protein I2492_05985 [Budviciaceae bacterium CWB-B4]|uniref:Uncharacterized protein n=1 Tax=Limnobaculum xujianqingii TaxID=2738837 RepID=A0A9D7AH15_9GAMM|nr:hypothetical protein [Limnobaculum xujianqingii]MBK5072558.1 hypothetical protein [Limnobaculum xujianqingii]MBK5175867.1 hypothetical protein [Limnobaculum xujianqingii]
MIAIVKAVLSAIKNNWLTFIITMAVLCIAWNLGQRSGLNEGRKALDSANQTIAAQLQQINRYEQDKREAAERHNQALSESITKMQAQTARANELSASLLKTQQQLATTKRTLQKRINDAVKNDSITYTGLGPDSLRAYHAALGYPTTGNLSPDSGRSAGSSPDATTTDGGLPPLDLLTHAGDYGEWCMKQYHQLQAIRQWNKGER